LLTSLSEVERTVTRYCWIHCWSLYTCRENKQRDYVSCLHRAKISATFTSGIHFKNTQQYIRMTFKFFIKSSVYTQLSIIRDNGGDRNHDQSKTQLKQILLKIL
jgi:hypothetical protein